MMGTICNSACVVREANAPTCDTTCTDKSGPAVFVSDSGNVQKIAEQDQPMCKSHMGKHVKMKAARVPSLTQQDQQDLRIFNMYEGGQGG